MWRVYTLDTRSVRFWRYSYSNGWKSFALSANTQSLDQSRIPYSWPNLIPLVGPDLESPVDDGRNEARARRDPSDQVTAHGSSWIVRHPSHRASTGRNWDVCHPPHRGRRGRNRGRPLFRPPRPLWEGYFGLTTYILARCSLSFHPCHVMLRPRRAALTRRGPCPCAFYSAHRLSPSHAGRGPCWRLPLATPPLARPAVARHARPTARHVRHGHQRRGAAGLAPHRHPARKRRHRPMVPLTVVLEIMVAPPPRATCGLPTLLATSLTLVLFPATMLITIAPPEAMGMAVVDAPALVFTPAPGELGAPTINTSTLLVPRSLIMTVPPPGTGVTLTPRGRTTSTAGEADVGFISRAATAATATAKTTTERWKNDMVMGGRGGGGGRDAFWGEDRGRQRRAALGSGAEWRWGAGGRVVAGQSSVGERRGGPSEVVPPLQTTFMRSVGQGGSSVPAGGGGHREPRGAAALSPTCPRAHQSRRALNDRSHSPPGRQGAPHTDCPYPRLPVAATAAAAAPPWQPPRVLRSADSALLSRRAPPASLLPSVHAWCTEGAPVNCTPQPRRRTQWRGSPLRKRRAVGGERADDGGVGEINPRFCGARTVVGNNLPE